MKRATYCGCIESRLYHDFAQLPGKSDYRTIGLGREGNFRIQPSLTSAVRTAWPATRPAHSFLKFRAYPLDVLPSGFRFLDRDNPANPLIACQWRNVLPFCQCHGVRNENLSQIRWYGVYRARRERFLVHGFHSTSFAQMDPKSRGLFNRGSLLIQ